jgi:hypothetical protein
MTNLAGFLMAEMLPLVEAAAFLVRNGDQAAVEGLMHLILWSEAFPERNRLAGRKAT